MKKVIYTLAILTSVVFASCNGQLNDDIDVIEGNLSDLQAENDALAAENNAIQAEIDAVSSDLDNVSGNLVDGGLDAVSPVEILHKYTSDGDIISETTKFLSFNGSYYEINNNLSSDYVKKSEALARVDAAAEASADQTYTHHVSIYGNSLDNGEFTLEFDYNSDTQKLSRFRYEVGQTYYSIYSNSSNVEQTLTINSFNTTTGEISLDFEMQYDEGYYNEAKVSFSINETLSVGNNNGYY